MANWFETVTKTLADDKLSRRSAMKKAAGAVAAVALASIIPGEAFAASDNTTCTPGNCSQGGFTNCGVNSNCYCFQKLTPRGVRGVCGCNTYCASAQPCSGQTCPKGYVCITNTGCGCTTGLCVHKCNKTCVLSSDRAGRTAA